MCLACVPAGIGKALIEGCVPGDRGEGKKSTAEPRECGSGLIPKSRQGSWWHSGHGTPVLLRQTQWTPAWIKVTLRASSLPG